MAKLINGNGNLAIYADEDADWFGSIFGDTTAITGIGNQFAYSLLDANTIGVQDGVIISKEGRRVQLNANEIDEFDIPTGAQGTTNYYIIGYRLYTDETSAQGCETFVELMDNGTDTIPEDTFRGGADEVYISLYRVKQVDLNITTVTLLLPTVSGIMQLNNDLSDNYGGTSDKFKFGTDGSGNYGYVKKVEGADTFFPFSQVSDLGNIIGYALNSKTWNGWLSYSINLLGEETYFTRSQWTDSYGLTNYKYTVVKACKVNITLGTVNVGISINGRVRVKQNGTTTTLLSTSNTQYKMEQVELNVGDELYFDASSGNQEGKNAVNYIVSLIK